MGDYTHTIRRLIDSVFGSSVKRLSISMTGLLTDVDISYEDGMTLTQAREWFNMNIPMLWNLTIERTYSVKALRSIGQRRTEDYNDAIMAEELLFSKDLRDTIRKKSHNKNKQKSHTLTF